MKWAVVSVNEKHQLRFVSASAGGIAWEANRKEADRVARNVGGIVVDAVWLSKWLQKMTAPSPKVFCNHPDPENASIEDDLIVVVAESRAQAEGEMLVRGWTKSQVKALVEIAARPFTLERPGQSQDADWERD